MSNKWMLQGWDAFEEECYSIPGDYGSLTDAELAAKARLEELEKTQPSETSGGQNENGIQDHVFIIHPDGRKTRFLG